MIKPPEVYLAELSKRWDNNIPTKFLWTIDFQSRAAGSMSTVAVDIQKVLQEYDDQRFALLPDLFRDRSNDTLGFLFAQSVSLPQEQVSVGTPPMKGSGGFVAGYYSDRRVDYGSENKLDVTFLEQNHDIVDLFIRPWLVATSYYGLIEGGPLDIKCNIVVNLHTRNPDGAEYTKKGFGTGWNLRKSYTFLDCVPITVEGDQISQGGDLSNDDLTRTASFAFTKYNMKDHGLGAGEGGIAAASGFLSSRFGPIA